MAESDMASAVTVPPETEVKQASCWSFKITLVVDDVIIVDGKISKNVVEDIFKKREMTNIGKVD